MSRMMRYLLYESDNQYVALSTAVTFLKKYLNLMQLRYSDNVTVNLDVPDETHEDIVLAPLVFIPFVENAFKHGVAYDKPSTIDIDIEKKTDGSSSTAATPRTTSSTSLAAWGSTTSPSAWNSSTATTTRSTSTIAATTMTCFSTYPPAAKPISKLQTKLKTKKL